MPGMEKPISEETERTHPMQVLSRRDTTSVRSEQVNRERTLHQAMDIVRESAEDRDAILRIFIAAQCHLKTPQFFSRAAA
jgi:hypothetical protein